MGQNAHAHFGDVINVVTTREKPVNDVYEKLVKSLPFERMHERQRNIPSALSTTCDWVSSHPSFVSWLDDSRLNEHHGFLWLKGKPGSGKSTIVKEALRCMVQQKPTHTVISYFFNARSPPRSLEKSTFGLHRSLLHQLLTLIPSTHASFVECFASKKGERSVEPWTEIEIQEFLIDLIRKRCLPPLFVFIDALDECADDDDIRRMVAFFEDCCEHAIDSSSTLRVCFSSRHYPHLSVERGLSLIVEKEEAHGEAIRTYVRRKLRRGIEWKIGNIGNEILQKSDGIFLWVVLVVERLNRIFDQGKGIKTIKRELHTVPDNLQDLFVNILRRDDADMPQCITLLQWVLFTLEPLTVSELYTAIQISCATCEEIDDELPDKEHLSLYLLNCSRGLIEIAGEGQPIVQFIHNTVREFLLNVDTSVLPPTIVTISQITFSADTMHMNMATECLKYLLNALTLSSSEAALVREYPLVLYAAKSWYVHVHVSNNPCSKEVTNIAVQLLTGSPNIRIKWLRIHDLDFPIRSRYKLTFRHPISALYQAVRFGIPDIISCMLDQGGEENVNARGGYFGTALQVACFYGSYDIARLLIDHGADVNIHCGQFGNALQAAALSERTDLVQLLLDHGADVNAHCGQFENALQAASLSGHHEVVRLLIEHGADTSSRSEQYDDTV